LFERVKTYLKRRNSVSIVALLLLLTLSFPRLFEDIAQMKFINTGRPWNDMAFAANVSPNFAAWEIGCFVIDIFMILFLIIQALRNDKRYSTE